MANRALFEGGQGRFSALGHTTVSVSTSSVGIDPANIPNDNRLRRTVFRAPGNLEWTVDGTDPSDGHGMYALADEVVVYDGDASLLRFYAATPVVVRVIFFGT